MEFLLAIITVFSLFFSLLWIREIDNANMVSDRVASAYKDSIFPEQQISERDRIFDLFPLVPAPLLFTKLHDSETVLQNRSLRLSTKFLGSLLASIAFGYVLSMLSAFSTNIGGYDVLQLSVALFGIAFFFTKTVHFSSENGNKDDLKKLRIVFLFFGLFIPIALGVFGGNLNFNLANSNYPENTARLIWALDLLRVFSLLLPICLFLFSLSEARIRIEQSVFENEDVALGSLTRIKELASVLISGVLALAILNVDLSSLSLFSGLAAAGLSVAMRETITNFFSGLQMTWDRSLKIGDVISIPRGDSSDTGSTYGIVKDIRSRYTVVEDRNTVRRLVPNFMMVSQTIEHWTHEDKSVRLSLRIGVPYVEDPRQVRQAQRIMESVCYDVPRVMTQKPPNALLVKYGESQLTFSLRFWIKDAQNGIRPVISEVLISLYERLSDAGIKIPFPQQDIRIKELPKLSKVRSNG